MSSQKTKGSSFERDVADTLSKAFGLPFSRSFGSGAFVGGKNRHRMSGLSKSVVNACKGDISCPVDAGWDFVVECKNYASLDFNGVVTGSSRVLSGWLEEARYDVDHEDNHALVFKVTKQGEYIALPYISKFSQLLHEAEVAHTLYPHYFTKDETEDMRWYVIFDFKVLKNIYPTYPKMIQTAKDYIEFLAVKGDNNG